MYKIPPDTLFIGKNIIYVPQCPSTNVLASELGQKVSTPDGSVVITDHQSAGRGQRGKTWESQPGTNLTFSMILKPGFLAVKDQFQLNEAISLGLTDYLTPMVAQKVQIKWPNDILIDHKKVCGILIENHVSGEEIGHSIIGIGLNVNQSTFQNPAATSLAMATGKTHELNAALSRLLFCLEARYRQLSNGKQKLLELEYLNLLYKKDEAHSFRSGADSFEGIITGVNEAGQLALLVGGKQRFFGLQEVSFL